MKYLCPSCERMVELERFRVDGARLWVTCPKCAVENGVEARGPSAVPLPAVGAGHLPAAGSDFGGPFAGAAMKVSLVSSPLASNVVALRTSATEAVQLAAGSREDPLAVPPGHCPKCLSKRDGDAVSCPQCGLVYARFNPAAIEVPEWLLDGWRELLGDWGNQLRHERLRSDASQRGALSQLGRLYRLRLAWFPDDPWAEAGRAEIVRMAEVVVSSGLADAEPANLEPSGPKARVLVLGGLGTTLAVGLAYLAYVMLKTG